MDTVSRDSAASHFHFEAAGQTKSGRSLVLAGRASERARGCESHLFVEQLLVLAGVAEEDVGQLGAHVVVLEVTNLWEPGRSEKKVIQQVIFFFLAKGSQTIGGAGHTDVLRTSCLIIPFSSLSWKNLFHRLCRTDTDRKWLE